MSPKEHPYRPEIDGLRMIAVVAVVLYHFGMPGLSGGFAGVDVFFVISGYLIGGILWRETRETGRISLARFYIRRVKRLAPAFFAMALATSVTAWLVLLPFEFREYGKSLIAATVYLSNVLFSEGPDILIRRQRAKYCSILGPYPWRSSSTSFCRSHFFCWRVGHGSLSARFGSVLQSLWWLRFGSRQAIRLQHSISSRFAHGSFWRVFYWRSGAMGAPRSERVHG